MLEFKDVINYDKVPSVAASMASEMYKALPDPKKYKFHSYRLETYPSGIYLTVVVNVDEHTLTETHCIFKY